MTSPSKRKNDVLLRRATEADIFKISELYFEVYNGTYPDPVVTNLKLLKNFISDPQNYWLVGEKDDQLVASLIYEYDPQHKIAKAFGAVVSTKVRHGGIAEALMWFALELINDDTQNGLEVTYATTRTVHAVAQLLTNKLDFKKLGIFPNVHRTTDYETHCLASRFSPQALAKRYSQFKLHPKILPLYKLAQSELNLPDIEIAPLKASIPFDLVHHFHLEVISAPGFVLERFLKVKQEGKLDNSFFPFHTPNVLITSPDQSTEAFLYVNDLDRHCVIIGINAEHTYHHNHMSLLHQIVDLLRTMNVRYIETIVRADKTIDIDNVIKAKFIPCAYFPAFQLTIDEKGEARHDFVVFSRSFEVFDFSNIQLDGIYKEFLTLYFEMWKEISLNPNLIPENNTDKKEEKE
ncbi:MAG: GNAT family N-acetyltransferase [Bacteriovoracaceae bacterium]